MKMTPTRRLRRHPPREGEGMFLSYPSPAMRGEGGERSEPGGGFQP